jgi:hypothetical protein
MFLTVFMSLMLNHSYIGGPFSGILGGIKPITGHEALLLNDYLFDENYTKYVRPRNNYNDRVRVKIEFVINGLSDLVRIRMLNGFENFQDGAKSFVLIAGLRQSDCVY